MKELFKDARKNILIYLVCVALIGIFLTFTDKAQNDENERTYNHGVCTECGGHYEFISVAKNHNTTYYYYKCDRCDKIIELRK